jgi:hypothetical protein
MLRTEKILEQYGLNMQDVSRKFDGIEDLIALLQEPITAETSAIIQTIDLRISQSLDQNELAKLAKKSNREKKEYNLEEAQSDIAKAGSISGFFDDDELDNLLNSGLDVNEGEDLDNVKMLIRKTFSKVDISEFFLHFSLGTVPLVSEDLNLIVRKNGMVVEGKFNKQFKATVQVQAEPILPLIGTNLDVTVSSYDRTSVESFDYGNKKPLIEEIQDELPKEVGDAEISSLFFSQILDKKQYRFDYVKRELENLDGTFSTWDLPVGALINPDFTVFSNYYFKPNYLYSLLKKGSLKQVGLREGSYITNSCKESKASGLVIYERGGSAHLNFDYRGKQINDFVSVDEQFESFVASKLNEAIENGKKAHNLGFSPINGNGKSGINHGGYFVHITDSLPDYMFVPAVIVNYFVKYHDINETIAFENDADSRILVFIKRNLVVGLYELPKSLVFSIKTVSQVFPTNANLMSATVYSKHTLNFLNKIDLTEVLGTPTMSDDNFGQEQVQKTPTLEKIQFDNSWLKIVEDAELMISLYLENPEVETFLDEAILDITLLEENGFTDKAIELKRQLQGNKQQEKDVKPTDYENDFTTDLTEDEKIEDDFDIDFTEEDFTEDDFTENDLTEDEKTEDDFDIDFTEEDFNEDDSSKYDLR